MEVSQPQSSLEKCLRRKKEMMPLSASTSKVLRATRLQRLQLASWGEIGNGFREGRLLQRAIRGEWGDRNVLTAAVMGVSGREVKLLELGSKESELYCM